MTIRLAFKYAVILLLCSCGTAEDPAYRKVFRYNESANITSLDPAFARDQAIIWATNQMFNGLVQLDEYLRVMPAIAASWDITDSGRNYTFHLRKDVRFHDDPSFEGGQGRRVVASDFVFSFRRILDPAVASPGRWIFNYTGHDRGEEVFSAPNDSTFVIRISKPFPPFLGLLAMQYCSVIPHEAVTFYGKEFRSHPVGTGPFMFRFWKEGIKLVMVKNPEYFEFENGKRLPYLDAVAITFIPDKQTALLDFLNGRLDFMSGIDPAYKDELLTHDGKLQNRYQSRIRMITQPYLNTEYLGFMVGGEEKDPRMAERKILVRKAMNLAFDRRKMIRYLRNNMGIPGLQGIIPAGLPAFDSTRIMYDYNPELASELLKQAGYPGGRGLGPVVLTSTPDYLDICKFVQHQVAKVGIDMQIEISTPAAVKEMKSEAKLPFFRASWIADYPDAENYLSMFCSRNFTPAGPNYTHYSNPGFDHLYEKALSETDDSLRNLLNREMDRIMMDDAPVIVLYYDQVLRFVQRDVSGLGINPMNLLSLKRVRK